MVKTEKKQLSKNILPQIKVSFEGIKDIPDDLKLYIEKKIMKIIAKFERGVVNCKFWFFKDIHHHKGNDRVKGIVYIKSKKICVSEKRGIDLKQASNLCLNALEKEMKKIYRDFRNKHYKNSQLIHKGTIHKVFPEEGYGFILDESGEDIFFHQNSLANVDFEKLTPPIDVLFELEDGRKGLNAVNIRIR